MVWAIRGVPLMVLLALGMCSSVSMAQEKEPREHRMPVLTVIGEGEATAAPDRAFLRLGATIESERAADAQARVNDIMQKTIQALRALDIPEAQIQTAELSIYPVYMEDPVPRGQPPAGPRIRGYRASNAVLVRVDELGLVGRVIDAGVEAGANSLDSLRFDLRDDTEPRKQALQQAAKRAQEKASALAEAMGVQLGPVQEIAEASLDFFPPEPRMARMAMAEMATPVQPGELTLTATITATYRIHEGARE